jgi:hypothetical protein
VYVPPIEPHVLSSLPPPLVMPSEGVLRFDEGPQRLPVSVWALGALAVAVAVFATALIMDSGRRHGSATQVPLATPPPACECAPASSAAQAALSSAQPPVVSVESLPLEGAPPPSLAGEKVERKVSDRPTPSRPSSSSASGPSRKLLARVLAQAAGNATACGPDAEGTARVMLTFAPSGAVTGIGFAGPVPAGVRKSCVLQTLSRARVPAWTGDSVSVAKTVRF